MRILVACVVLTLCLFLTVPAVAGEPVNVNEASAEKLQTLNGVGEVLAGRIIDYREAHDGFESVAQLNEVKGIGSATLDDLEDKVTVDG